MACDLSLRLMMSGYAFGQLTRALDKCKNADQSGFLRPICRIVIGRATDVSIAFAIIFKVARKIPQKVDPEALCSGPAFGRGVIAGIICCKRLQAFQAGYSAVQPQGIVRALIFVLPGKFGGNADAIQSIDGDLERGISLVIRTRGPHALAQLSNFFRSGVTSVKHEGMYFVSTGPSKSDCEGEPVIDFEVPTIPVIFEKAAPSGITNVMKEPAPAILEMLRRLVKAQALHDNAAQQERWLEVPQENIVRLSARCGH
jgi:hypothetical protein